MHIYVRIRTLMREEEREHISKLMHTYEKETETERDNDSRRSMCSHC